MYLDFFGLNEAPFRITPNTGYWHDGGQRGELLAALLYSIGQGEGLIKVVGEVGSGKTMLCRKLAAQLPDTVDTVYLGNPSLGPDDLLAAILADLGIASPEPTRQARLAQLNTLLLERHQSGRRVVVFVEEAQGHTLDNLEFLRLLTNLETATDKLLQLVFFGQPELDTLLADPRIRQLKDRITLHLTLPPLNEAEVGDYLRARLSTAGYRGPDLFAPPLVTHMTRLSGGLSRRINVLADKTLLAAYAAQTHTLNLDHLNAAAGDADPVPKTSRPLQQRLPSFPRFAWITAGIAVGLLILAAWAWNGLRPEPVAGNATAAQTTPTRPAEPDPTALAESTRQWLAAAPTNTHVIQLAAAKDARQAAVLWKDHQSGAWPAPVRLFYGLRQGQPAWMLLAGEFSGRRPAQAALNQLNTARAPAGGEAPFLRSVGKMRTLGLPVK